jgi:putative transposase
MHNKIIKKQNRQSIRLKGYDYSVDGFYFITLCSKNRINCFSNIKDNKLELLPGGIIVEKYLNEIALHFPNTILHEYIIMPNHIHFIIEITDDSTLIKGMKVFSRLPEKGIKETYSNSNFKSPSKTIGSIIRGFKIGVTKWFRTNSDIYYVWQRNYYENIIRNEKSYAQIKSYILDNPKNWSKDNFCNDL